MRLGCREDRQDVIRLYLRDCFFLYIAISEVAMLKLLSAKTHKVNKIIIEYKPLNPPKTTSPAFIQVTNM